MSIWCENLLLDYIVGGRGDPVCASENNFRFFSRPVFNSRNSGIGDGMMTFPRGLGAYPWPRPRFSDRHRTSFGETRARKKNNTRLGSCLHLHYRLELEPSCDSSLPTPCNRWVHFSVPYFGTVSLSLALRKSISQSINALNTPDNLRMLFLFRYSLYIGFFVETRIDRSSCAVKKDKCSLIQENII